MADVDQADSDQDDVGNLCDNCPAHPNVNQADCDANSMGDVCELALCVGDPSCGDCNVNGVPDGCDLRKSGTITRLVASDGDSGDAFGSSMSMHGDRLIIDAHLDEEKGVNAGAAYVLEHQNDHWVEGIKLLPEDNSADDRFGAAVAIDGHWAAVGAPFDDDLGANSGSVAVFQIVDDSWQRKCTLTASDAMSGDQFGSSVSLAGDRAVVGAIGDDDRGLESGDAYVFRYDGTVWSQEIKLTAPDGMAGDVFGSSVSMVEDIIVVGARVAGDDARGSVYVYRNDGSTWVLEQQLTGSDTSSGDEFGASVSIHGNIVAVGAWRADSSEEDSGATYVFQYDSATMTWIERTKLFPQAGSRGAHFGAAVAVYLDSIGVGAVYDSQQASKAGAGYFFRYRNEQWVEVDVFRKQSASAKRPCRREAALPMRSILSELPSVWAQVRCASGLAAISTRERTRALCTRSNSPRTTVTVTAYLTSAKWTTSMDRRPSTSLMSELCSPA